MFIIDVSYADFLALYGANPSNPIITRVGVTFLAAMYVNGIMFKFSIATKPAAFDNDFANAIKIVAQGVSTIGSITNLNI